MAKKNSRAMSRPPTPAVRPHPQPGARGGGGPTKKMEPGQIPGGKERQPGKAQPDKEILANPGGDPQMKLTPRQKQRLDYLAKTKGKDAANKAREKFRNSGEIVGPADEGGDEGAAPGEEGAAPPARTFDPRQAPTRELPGYRQGPEQAQFSTREYQPEAWDDQGFWDGQDQGYDPEQEDWGYEKGDVASQRAYEQNRATAEDRARMNRVAEQGRFGGTQEWETDPETGQTRRVQRLGEGAQDIVSAEEQFSRQTRQAGLGVSQEALGRLKQPYSFEGMSKVYGEGDLEGARNKAADSVYNRQMRQLEPQMKQERQEFEQMAAERGWVPGSEIYEREKSRMGESQRRQQQDISDQAYQTGSQEMSQMRGYSAEDRSRQIGEMEALRSRPIAEAEQLMGMGSGARIDEFADYGPVQQADVDTMAAYGIEAGERQQGRGLAEARRSQTQGEQFQSREASAQRGFARGERMGAEDWAGYQDELQRDWQSGERMGAEDWSSRERIGSEDFSRGERMGSEDWAGFQQGQERDWQTGERLGTQKWTGGQSAAQRKWEARQNDLNRQASLRAAAMGGGGGGGAPPEDTSAADLAAYREQLLWEQEHGFRPDMNDGGGDSGFWGGIGAGVGAGVGAGIAGSFSKSAPEAPMGPPRNPNAGAAVQPGVKPMVPGAGAAVQPGVKPMSTPPVRKAGYGTGALRAQRPGGMRRGF